MTLSLDLLLGFALFALVTSITPGPNNTMLLASGVNFGFNRTIPHMLGITCGFFVLVVAVGFGLGAVFQTYPILYTVLRYLGAALGSFAVAISIASLFVVALTAMLPPISWAPRWMRTLMDRPFGN